MPVGFEIAAALGASLDALVAPKVAAPGRPELGIGAIAEGDGMVANQDALRALGLSPQDWDRLVAQERRELEPLVPDLERKDVVVVDDGLATGVTAEAAIICSISPRNFTVVGRGYEDFDQPTGDEALQVLDRAVAATGR